MRNKEKYPKIILLNSSGYYPERYIQVTKDEAADLKKNRIKYHGSFSRHNNLNYLYGGKRYKNGSGKEDRTISVNEVDILPKNIPCYCEYE